jgi:hypothetical protein
MFISVLFATLGFLRPRLRFSLLHIPYFGELNTRRSTEAFGN